jgi:hypothetical protein
MIEVKDNFSGRMLLRLIILGVALLIILATARDFIENLYFSHQLTPIGKIINGGIIILFLLGLVKVTGGLLRYMWEESALAKFVRRLDQGLDNPVAGINPKSIVYRRFQSIQELGRQNAPINHSALASTLLASESTRTSFAKYISNILILTGVFGTIVSLSIALVGESSLLEKSMQELGDLGDMGLVIHGMSTALSTTITAIVCYLFYGYFYLKLHDAQTHVIAGVEEVTTLYLLPRYSHDKDSMLHEVAGLVRGLRQAAESLHVAHMTYAEAGDRLHEVISAMDQRMSAMVGEVGKIKQFLRDGFRLPPEDK